MKKQEVNTFNISFLDLMTGAFAAVIILFIVVPKMNKQDREAVEKLKKLKVEMVGMDSMLYRLKKSIPEKEYDAIVRQTGKMQGTMQELELEIEKLRQDVQAERSEKEKVQAALNELEGQLAATKEQVEKLLGEKEKLLAENKYLKDEVARLNGLLGKVAIDEKKTGVNDIYVPIDTTTQKVVDTTKLPKSEDVFIATLNAPLGIVAAWGDDKADIDLYLAKGNQYCYNYVRNREMPFAHFVAVKGALKKFFNDKTTEIIAQQKEVKPGDYQVILHKRSPNSGETMVKLKITFAAPGKVPMQLTENVPVTYTKDAPYRGGGKIVGTLKVTEDGISLQPAN